MAVAAYAKAPEKYPWVHVSDWAEGHDAQEQLIWLTCRAIGGHLDDHYSRDAIQVNYETAVECGYAD